jgi:protein TonB
MLDLLTTSSSRRQVASARVMLAAALHGAIIFGAIRATAPHLATGAPARQVEFVSIADASFTPEPAAASAASGEETVLAPAVEELPVPPLDIPSLIPPIAPGPALDPTALRTLFPPGTGNSGSADSADLSRVIRAADADQPASIVHQPSPRYPPALQRAGIEGTVLLEFIIDPGGHPEPASLRVIERTAPGFDAAALETITRSLFRPARLRGRVVRQLTRQLVVFRIAPE